MVVLLLDATYEPLKIISWVKAINLVLSGNAEIVEEDSSKQIRSATQSFKMPSVIRQFSKFKRKGCVQFSRVNVYLRDDWTCQYCFKKKLAKDLTFDHVIPRSRGGSTSWTNIVTSCRPCNVKKSSRTPEEAGLVLLKLPKQPKWLPSYVTVRLTSIPEEWQVYVQACL